MKKEVEHAKKIIIRLMIFFLCAHLFWEIGGDG